MPRACKDVERGSNSEKPPTILISRELHGAVKSDGGYFGTLVTARVSYLVLLFEPKQKQNEPDLSARVNQRQREQMMKWWKSVENE